MNPQQNHSGAGDSLFGSDPISSHTYKEQAYRLIKDAIIYRKMKVGVVYSQDGICVDMQISRTPVREALLELQQEGYVSILRGRGITIVPLGQKEARDIIEMRRCIEPLGNFLAAQRRSSSQLGNLFSALQEMEKNAGSSDNALMYRLDREFHYHMFQAADNGWLQRTNEQLRDHILRFENQEAFQIVPVLEEHRGVYRAIERGNPAEAAEAMRIHMANSIRRTMSHIVPLGEENADPTAAMGILPPVIR